MARIRERQGAVPHHEVEAALYDEAKSKADLNGDSLSGIAAVGLAAYAADAPPETAEAALRKAKGDLRLAPLVQELPAETAEAIAQYHKTRDPLLGPFLAACHHAGWSYQALAQPMGVSRQTVYDRVRQWRGLQLPPNMPPVPEPPFTPPVPHSLGYERVNWSVWVNRETYAVASREARRRGEPMRVVMENILRDYLNDQGPWASGAPEET